MATYSTSDLSRKSGDIIAEALRRPVTITQRGKPRLMIVRIDDYERMRAASDTRRHFRLDAMPDDLSQQFDEAVARLADEPAW
jgi:prevent-host-death family protein